MIVDWFNRQVEAEPEPEVVSVLLKDNTEVTFALRPLGLVGQCQASDTAAEFAQKYITGDPSTGSGAIPFPPVGGSAVKLSPNLVNIACDLGWMTVAKEGCQKPDVEEYVAMAIAEPEAFEKLYRKAQALNIQHRRRQAGERGKPPGGE